MITVRLFAAAREAVGTSTIEVDATSLAQMCEALVAAAEPPRRAGVAAVLSMSSLMHEGVRYRAADAVGLPDGAVVDVLPPFAGG